MRSRVLMILMCGFVIGVVGCNSHKDEKPKSLNEKLPPAPQGGGGSLTKKAGQPANVEQ